MFDYNNLKLIHIISSTILFGTGIGSAFYMFIANRQKNVTHIYYTVKNVVIADWFFTATSGLVQLITGILLISEIGYDLHDFWLKTAIILYFFAMMCWLPVVYLQIKMRDIAKIAMENNQNLPLQYWTYDKYWIILGSLAFPALVIVFYLMIFKPV